MSANDIVTNDSITKISSVKSIAQILTDEAITLDDLTDVSITAPALSNSLIYTAANLWENRELPSLSIYFNGSAAAFGTTLNIYHRWTPVIVGVLPYAPRGGLSHSPTTNYFTYTGPSCFLKIDVTVTPFTSTANRYVWGVFIKNPTFTSSPVTAPPNLPVGSIPQSLVRAIGQNLNANMTTHSNTFAVQVNNGDVLGYFQANVSNGDGHAPRDFRINMEFLSLV